MNSTVYCQTPGCSQILSFNENENLICDKCQNISYKYAISFNNKINLINTKINISLDEKIIQNEEKE
jgi:hypothetical protein